MGHWRRLLCAPIKLIAEHLIKFLVCIASFPHQTLAEDIGHGTYFLAGLSPDYAVVAIDSRELEVGVPNDRYCKIRPLSRNAFFFSRGVTSATDNNTHDKIFDARDIAHSVYVQFGIGSTRFDEMAQAWAERVLSIYRTKPSEFANYAVQNIMVGGFFVGLDESGTIKYSSQRIVLQPYGFPQFINSAEPKPVGSTNPEEGPTYASGYFEIVREFMSGNRTERAKAVIDNLGTLPSGPDRVAAIYAAIVNSVAKWSGEIGIGGDIAAIILERGQDWRWYHRPDFCPQY